MANFGNVARLSKNNTYYKYLAFNTGNYVFYWRGTNRPIKFAHPSEGIMYVKLSSIENRTSTSNNIVHRIYFCLQSLSRIHTTVYHYAEDVSGLPVNATEAEYLNFFINAFNTTYQEYTISFATLEEVFEYILSEYTSFHKDPIYLEATKLKYTDGTYNFIEGVADSNRSRKAAYRSLLNSYGSFYKGTEEQLSNSYIQGI